MTEHKHDVFISYSHADQKVIESVMKALESEGLTTWSDQTISAGENWNDSIEEALQEARVYLLFITPDFLASEWSNFEMGVAASRAASSPDVHLIAVLLRGTSWKDLPPVLRDKIAIDATAMSPDELSEKLRYIIGESLAQ